MFDLGKGNLNFKDFENIRNDSKLKEDPEEVEYFKQKNISLMK